MRQRYFYLFMISLTFARIFSQEGKMSGFSFIDADNNKITVLKLYTYPEKIDSAFLVQNINGKLLNEKLVSSGRRYEFTIDEITTVRKDKKYQMKARIRPFDSDPEKTKTTLGTWVYIIETKRSGKLLSLEKIVLDHFGL